MGYLEHDNKMSILPILEIPHPTLRARAKRIRSIDKKVLKLAHNMVDTMRESKGVGLAANQVGELLRIIVLQMPEEEEARIYFNPVITRRNGTREVEEGCLSLPGLRGIVERSIWIKFQGVDHTEKLIKFGAENLLSQAIEHEVDHLNGILYPDHLLSHGKLYIVDEISEILDAEDSDSNAPNNRIQAPKDEQDAIDDPKSSASVKIK
jgi:peptide deformylase